ncbi:MAG: smalltalk protein [Mediterranea sp.]|nr:smalltalk protein [Mediterranea sp.]
MKETTRKKGFSWNLLLIIVIAVASAVADALGVSTCR